MTITRTLLKDKILRLVHKTTTFKGPYTDDKLNDAIQEAIDFVAAELGLAEEGWQVELAYLSPAAGDSSATIPSNTMMLREVRFWNGSAYVPMLVDPAVDRVSNGGSGGLAGTDTQPACRYRTVGNTLVFDPPLADGGTNYLQLECVKLPTAMSSDSDTTPAAWSRIMEHFIKYKSASILTATIERFARPWAAEEAQWYQKILDIGTKRNMQSTPIREFGA